MIVYRCKIKIHFQHPCVCTHIDTSTRMYTHFSKYYGVAHANGRAIYLKIYLKIYLNLKSVNYQINN